jgi:N-acetylglucosamine malate deacetylase 1
VLECPDGELLPTLEHRNELIGIIRDFRPDLVLFPRPNDYHPDHRYTAQLAQDALYMVRVPNVCALHDRLKADPIAMYVSDPFQKPTPFQADMVIDLGAAYEQKLAALACHASQVFEWLPFVDRDISAGDVPHDEAGRLAFLRDYWDERFNRDADRFRHQLIAAYGRERGDQIAYAEAFEVCELGAPLTPEDRLRLFPF